MSGVFITFEGIEGSGKSTLLNMVAAAIRRSGRDPVVTREPGGTSLGIALRKVVLNPDIENIDPMVELMLFAADRAQHIVQVIAPALEKGKIVLCDRFSDATLAYQGSGRCIPMEDIISVDRLTRGKTKPHLTILLDLPVETGLSRVRLRNAGTSDNSETRIDEEEIAFHKRVREGYLNIAGKEPDRFLVLNGLEEPDRLEQLVTDELYMRFPDVF